MAIVKSNSRKLKIPANESYLNEVRDFVTEIARSFGFDTKDISSIKLAVDEGCTNIIRHAYRDIPNGVIEVLAVVKQRVLSIVLIDHGKGFDFKKASDPNLQTYMKIGKKGGLGIFLMKKLMDEVEYHVTSRGNELWLTKRRKREEEKFLKVIPKELSLKTKLTVLIAFMFSCIAAGSFGYLYRSQEKEIEARIYSQGISIVRNLSLDAWVDLSERNDLNLASQVKNVVEENPLIAEAFITDSQNKIWAHSDIRKTFSKYAPPRNIQYIENSNDHAIILSYALPKGKRYVQISTPIQVTGPDSRENEALIGRANITIPIDAIADQVDEAQERIRLIALFVLAFGNIGVFALSYLLMKPFQRLATWVRGMGEGSVDESLVLDTNDELGEIAEAFNDMAYKFRKAQGSLVEKERLQQEVMVAQEIQHMLLPRSFPKVEGFDIASFYRAAKEVGGDYFDFVWVDPDTLGLVVADVSGKGVPGSLVMTMIRTTLRLEARGNRDAADVLSKVNRFVSDDIKKGMFVTMFYIVLDSRRRRIDFASAGHNPLILYRNKTQKSYYLNPEGFPVGISFQDKRLFDESIHSDHLSLYQGDLLIAYTDGLTEAMNANRELFGEERFLSAIRKYAHLNVNEFVENIRQEIQNFTQGFAQNDDITLVAIQEKLHADSHLQEFRSKLINLVEKEGLSVKEACHRMRVSPSTYYRYKRRWDEEGEEGLKNRIERDHIAERHVSIEDRAKILNIIKNDPDFGAKRIGQELNTDRYGFTQIGESLIYEELKRLSLNTVELRRRFVERSTTQTKRLQAPGTPLLTIDGHVIGAGELDPKVSNFSSGDEDTAGEKRLQATYDGESAGQRDVMATNMPTGDEAPVGGEVPAPVRPMVRGGLKRIPPRSPLWSSPIDRMSLKPSKPSGDGDHPPQERGMKLPSHPIHPMVRSIPLVLHHHRDLGRFVQKEVERTASIGKKILLLDCSGLAPDIRILWNDLMGIVGEYRQEGGDIFLWNLRDSHLHEYQKYGVDRKLVHVTSARDLEERLRFLRL